MYTTVIYIIFERGISFLIILKLFEFSGFQTKMVFKLSFKYLKNEKINLSKVILKLECLFYQNIYIYIILSYFIFVEPFLTQKNPKIGLIEKKNTPNFEIGLKLIGIYPYPTMNGFFWPRCILSYKEMYSDFCYLLQKT